MLGTDESILPIVFSQKQTPRLASQGAPPLLSPPTTSFSTATTLAYTIRFGFTAGAGTMIVLELFLIKVCTFDPFQLRYGLAVSHCYLLSLPRVSPLWQVTRLLPSLEVVAVSQAPSPE